MSNFLLWQLAYTEMVITERYWPAFRRKQLYEAIRDLNGRLLPWGWLKLLWRFKITSLKTLRVPLMGVRRKHHNSRTGAALALSVTGGVRFGITIARPNWRAV